MEFYHEPRTMALLWEDGISDAPRYARAKNEGGVLAGTCRDFFSEKISGIIYLSSVGKLTKIPAGFGLAIREFCTFSDDHEAGIRRCPYIRCGSGISDNQGLFPFFSRIEPIPS